MAGDLVIVAGFGFRSSATAESLADALSMALQARCGAPEITRIATAEDKLDHAAFARLAQDLQLPARGVDAETLRSQNTVTGSAASRAAKGTGSVAEAAALAAAGPKAKLLVSRRISGDGRATCALAKGRSE